MNIKEVDGQLFRGKQPITNFVPIVVRIYVPPGAVPFDLVLPDLVLSLQLQIGACRAAQTLKVPFGDLDKLDFPRQVPGCVYEGKNGKLAAANFIRLQVGQLLKSNDRCGTYFQSSGWHIKDGKMVYIMGNEIATAAGIERPVGDYIDPKVSALSLVRNPELSAADAAERLINALCGYREYAFPTFAYTLYASNRSLWGEVGMPATCVLNIQGIQDAGKTQLARRFCALYKEENSIEFADFYDAEGTLAGIRPQLAFAQDRIVVCDDICMSTNPSTMAKRRRLAADLLRFAANETPFIKMNGKTEMRLTCTAGLVITGELPVEVASDITRTITLKINEDLRGRPKADRILAASALAEYLCWLCGHRDCELSRLRSDFKHFKEETKPGRLETSLFQLSWIFDSFLRFAVDVGAIDSQAQAELSDHLTHILKKIYQDQMRDIQRIQGVQSVSWQQLAMEGAMQKAFPFHSRQGCICITPEDFTKYCRVRLDNPTLKPEAIIADLRAKHLLAMDKSGKSTKKIDGVRHLCILTQQQQ